MSIFNRKIMPKTHYSLLTAKNENYEKIIFNINTHPIM